MGLAGTLVTSLITSGGCYVFWKKRRTVSMDRILSGHSFQLHQPPFTTTYETADTSLYDEDNPVPFTSMVNPAWVDDEFDDQPGISAIPPPPPLPPHLLD